MTEFSSDWKLTATRQRFSLPQTLVYYIAKNPPSPEFYNKIIKCCKYFWLKNPVITLNELRHYYNDIGILRSETTIGSANIINAQLENVVDKLWIHQKLIVGDEQKQLLASSLMPKIYRCDLTSLSLGFQNICFDDFKVFISSGSLEYLGLHKTIVEADDGIIVPIEELIELLPNLQEFVFSNVTTDEGLQTITSKTAANLIAIPNFPKVQIFRLYKIPELFNFEAFFTVPKVKIFLFFSR